MKGRSCHSSAKSLYSFASHSAETQESLQWLTRPCMSSPLPLWPHFLQLFISTLLPYWPPRCPFLHMLTSKHFFLPLSSPIWSQGLHSSPAWLKYRLISKVSLATYLHCNPSIHLPSLFSFQPFAKAVITITHAIHSIRLSCFFCLPSLGFSSMQPGILFALFPAAFQYLEQSLAHLVVLKKYLWNE